MQKQSRSLPFCWLCVRNKHTTEMEMRVVKKVTMETIILCFHTFFSFSFFFLVSPHITELFFFVCLFVCLFCRLIQWSTLNLSFYLDRPPLGKFQEFHLWWIFNRSRLDSHSSALHLIPVIIKTIRLQYQCETSFN